MRAPDGHERTGWTDGLYARLVTLAGCSNHAQGYPCESAQRISRAYVVAAWVFLLAGIVLWHAFLAVASGFYFGAILLRREGL